MKLPTPEQFQAAKFVNLIKDSDNALNELDYVEFIKLYKVIHNPDRYWPSACAKDPSHTVLITRRGYIIENALTGAEEDDDMLYDAMDCSDCGNGEYVVDEYTLNDFIEVAKEK